MLDGLKRLFSRAPAPSGNWEAIITWAESRRLDFRPVRDDGGFVIEAKAAPAAWRLEWGPSQRPYLKGAELRLRGEVAESAAMQAMVLDGALQVEMERSVFEQYVEGVQTRIDNETPPEMRWLVLYPKLEAAELGPLRERFAAVCASKPWMMTWLDGPLGPALLAAPLMPGEPMALVLARGRLTLRVSLPSPTPRALEEWLQVFQVALREARRATEEVADSESGGPSSASPWLPSRDGEAPPDGR
jgi:hypothetical protein